MERERRIAKVVRIVAMKDQGNWLWAATLSLSTATLATQKTLIFGSVLMQHSIGLSAADFLEPDQIIQLGYSPARIDSLTTVPGVDFEDCYRSRLEVQTGGITVSVIDLENLKRNKRASGRLQDLLDLENLE